MASFRNLAERLGELSTVPSRCAARAAEAIGKLIDEEFQQGQDAYGDGWADLSASTLRKGRTPPPLTDTGKLRDAVRVRPLRGSGIEITAITPYSGFHQSGTRNMPSRPILPDGTELPDSWQDAIDSAYKAALKGKR